MGHRMVAYESIRAGQPRPYADSVYEGIISFRPPWAPYGTEQVKRFAAAFLGYEKVYDKGEARGWWQPYFEEVVQIDCHNWRIKVTLPYTD